MKRFNFSLLILHMREMKHKLLKTILITKLEISADLILNIYAYTGFLNWIFVRTVLKCIQTLSDNETIKQITTPVWKN